jgi:omega-6 fatty acid desaturase (delta-12 desaturase)
MKGNAKAYLFYILEASFLVPENGAWNLCLRPCRRRLASPRPLETSMPLTTEPGPGRASPCPQPATAAQPAAAGADKQWLKILARYRDPDTARSVYELLITAMPFFGLWAIMLLALRQGYWWGLILAIPAAGFLVRLFMIQHDCGHGSFFRNRLANHTLGRAIGVLTLTPYDYWRRTHAMHHATSGNLDRRGMGDVPTLTVAEYVGLPRWRRLTYRLSRNPLILLALGPIYLFLLKHRLPFELMDGGKEVWISAMATNLGIGGIVVGMSALIGIHDFLLIQLPITLLASSIGIWLFYVQHQFEHTYWDHQDAWTFHAGAMEGSTHFDLPAPLRWFTANIGIHHVHHLASRIPSYRLNDVLRDHPALRNVSRLTLGQSFRCFRLALWDEERRRLVGFRDLRGLRAA